MDTKCCTSSNLALEHVREASNLVVVKSLPQIRQTSFSSSIVNAFGYLHDTAISSDVIAVLQGKRRFEFLAGATEARFAFVVAGISLVALYGLSFFV